MRKTKLLLTLAASACLLSGCGQKEKKPYNEGINVIPRPASLTPKEGTFRLTSGTKVAADTTQPGLRTTVNYFTDKIKRSTGYGLDVVGEAPASGYISIAVDTALNLGEEGYTLVSSDKGVEIVGKTPRGAFYGMQTLMQLFPAEIESPEIVRSVEWTAPAVEVRDEPRFPYRGLHLDVCRHFADIDFVKKQLDVLALFKVNKFHWHLTDDQGWRIEIKKYPKLTGIGSVRHESDGTTHEGYYTQDQIREVVQYAADRFIEVIPEIELPGHAVAALTAYPEYSCTGGPFQVREIWGISDDIFCAGNDSTLSFINDVIDEVAALFPGQYLHIGGDEAPKGRWEACPKCQARMAREGLKNEAELQSWFMARAEEMAQRHGKKIIGWEEMLEGGATPTATIMSWWSTEKGIEAANQGYDAIMTPADPLYLDRYQGDLNAEPFAAIGSYEPLEKVYAFDPVPDSIAPDKRHHIQGAQGNLWREYLYTDDQVEYRVYPRILALAELTWTPKEEKDWPDFARRIDNAYVRLDQHGINYHIPLPEGPLARTVGYEDSVSLAFTNTRDYPMVYTLDGKDPDAGSERYTQPLVFRKDGELKIATLLPSGKTSLVRDFRVKKMDLAPALDVETRPGIRVKVAAGDFKNAEEMKAARFGPDTVVRKFTDIPYGIYDPKVAVYEGYFEVPEDGIYTFGTDVERLYIDDEEVFNGEGRLRRHMRDKAMKGLKAGKHKFVMVYNNRVTKGVPAVWTQIVFSYKAPSSDTFVRVTPDRVTYQP